MSNPDPLRYADESLDPASREAFDPDPPQPADWKRVSDQIAARVLPRKATPKSYRRIPVLIGLAIAASAVVAVWIWATVTPVPIVKKTASPPPPKAYDPLDAYDVLPIASDEELRIATLRGDWGAGLVVGTELLSGELRIATADEITVERIPNGMDTIPESGNLPMILSLKGKRTGE